MVPVAGGFGWPDAATAVGTVAVEMSPPVTILHKCRDVTEFDVVTVTDVSDVAAFVINTP